MLNILRNYSQNRTRRRIDIYSKKEKHMKFFGLGFPELTIVLLIVIIIVLVFKWNNIKLYFEQKKLQNNNQDNTATTPGDSPSLGYAVLGFIIPLVGLILYIVWKDQFPLRARSAGKGALMRDSRRSPCDTVIRGSFCYELFFASIVVPIFKHNCNTSVLNRPSIQR